MTHFANQEKLLHRLVTASKSKEKFTFLVGAGLTSSWSGIPGVASVSEIIDKIHGVLKENDSYHFLEEEQKQNGSSNLYQLAMKVLLECNGQSKLNEIIMQGVLNARRDSTSPLILKEGTVTTMSLERDVDNWYLNDAVENLSKLYILDLPNFPGPILTSNFDPLIEIGIRKFGGDPITIAINKDGSFGNILGDSKQVVHFHGFWHGGDTMHTVDQITNYRPQLKGSLKKLLSDTVLIVTGYGGWDDALTKTLIELSAEGGTDFNILWTFYEEDEVEIKKKYKGLLESFGSSVGQRIVLYKGVNAHTFFPEVYRRIIKHTKVDTKVEVTMPQSQAGGSIFHCDTPTAIDKLIGRKSELQSLANRNFKVIFITGIGGQGKSGLASYYITQKVSGENYWEYWDWRDFKEEADRFKTKLILMIERVTNGKITPHQLKDEDIDSIIPLFFKELGSHKIVFVLDNIDNMVDFEKHVPIGPMAKFCDAALNTNHYCKFIFTCRANVVITSGSFLPINLGGLSSEETGEFFDTFNMNFKVQDKTELVKKAHELTDGHPLWLALIAGQALRGKDNVFKFIDSVKSHPDIQTTDLAEKTLNAIWTNLNDKLQVLLRGMAELNKAETENNIVIVLENDLSHHQVRKGIRALKSLNLVETKSKQTFQADEYDLHPLVKTFVRSKFPQQERKRFISSCVNFYGKLLVVFKKQLSYETPYSVFENYSSKIELEVTNEDFTSALAGLHEINAPMRAAGYDEEFFRVLKLLFDKIDWKEAIFNEYEYFHDEFQELVELLTMKGRFEEANSHLEYYKTLISGKGYHYLIYCDMKCYLHWYKEEFLQAIEIGESALILKDAGKVDMLIDLRHNYALALRDSREKANIEKSLDIFRRGESESNILSDNVAAENNFGPFFGNIGRCYHFLNRLDEALTCYKRSYLLLQDEHGALSLSNQGYAFFWIGECLERKNKLPLAYCFYRQACVIWDKVSPPRAEKANIRLLGLKGKDGIDHTLLTMSTASVLKQCMTFIES